MKTTIEIDEEKLSSIMRMTGISTMKDAVDWALNEAMRIATINHVMEHPWTAEEAKNAVDPDYDIIAIRNSSVPVKYQKKPRARSK